MGSGLKIVGVTIRDSYAAGGDLVLDLESRFADGQKFAAIQVDGGLPALAESVCTFLNDQAKRSAEQESLDQLDSDQPDKAALYRNRALREILIERKRQITGEGFSLEHDAEHTHGELVQAAADLCLDGTDFRVVDLDGDRMIGWGLTEKHHSNRRRQLVIAAALILAEIERLDRMEKGKLNDEA